MSGKKTRHLKQFVIGDGGRFVYNVLTGRYHYRFSHMLDDWPRLVQSVRHGGGALLNEDDLEFFRRNVTATVVMG